MIHPRRRLGLLIKGLGRGGAEQILVDAARYLDRDRFEYQFLYVLPQKNAHVGTLEGLGFSVVCLGNGSGMGWIAQLRRHVRDEHIELLHCHSPVPAVAARVVLARARPTLVYTEHNLWSRYRRATRWANRITFGRNDHVFCVSNEVRSSVRLPRIRSSSEPPVETLYYGIDLARLETSRSGVRVRKEMGIPADVPLVVTVANFKAHKGHQYLLEATPFVRDELPEARFVLAGVGPLETDLRARVRRMEAGEYITFAGFREDPLELMAAADVFCLPSLQEGLPVALMEAMGLGKAVVVTRTGGVEELVRPNREGLIVAPGDAEALGRALKALLRDPRRREYLGSAARARMQELDIRKAVRRTEKIYEKLLAQ